MYIYIYNEIYKTYIELYKGLITFEVYKLTIN